MLTDTDRARLSAIAKLAEQRPLDFRDFTNPNMFETLTLSLTAQSVKIGTLVIAYSHDRMPPDWRSYRHLSVSDGGQPPSTEVFMEIASLVGMGVPKNWDEELVRFLENALPVRIDARHAFQPV